MDRPAGPDRSVAARLDLSGLAEAARSYSIATDVVRVELRRTSDSSMAYSGSFPGNLLSDLTGTFVVHAEIPLTISPEQFYLHIDVLNSGTVYYTVDAIVTLIAGLGVSTPPLVPRYVGPGGGADSLVFLLIPPAIIAGDSVLAAAQVFSGGLALSQIPIGYVSSDPSKVRVHPSLLGTAWLVADKSATGTVPITASTPGGLSRSASLTVLPIPLPIPPPPPVLPSALQLVSGDGQRLLVGLLSQPLVVRVLDASGQPYTAGLPVNFGLTGLIPLGTRLTSTRVISDNQGLAQTALLGGAIAGVANITATGEGLTTAPVQFVLTLLPALPLVTQ
jgi:hypothetical protein